MVEELWGIRYITIVFVAGYQQELRACDSCNVTPIQKWGKR
jgi:hypothetical protein